MGAIQNNKPEPKRRKKKSSGHGNWGGFIDCPLGKAERKGFEKHLTDSKVDVWKIIQNMCDTEMNLSVTYSEDNESYVAKATATNPEDGRLYMLSAFHGDPETAFRLLAFKHDVLLAGEWWGDMEEDKDKLSWG